MEIKSQATHYLTQSTQGSLIGPNITEDYDAGKSAEQKKTRDNFIVRDGSTTYTVLCTTPLNTSKPDQNVVTFDVYDEAGEIIGQKIKKLEGDDIKTEYKYKKDGSKGLETTKDPGKIEKLNGILGKLRICAKENKMLNENANIYCETEDRLLHKKFEGRARDGIIGGNKNKLKNLKGNVESEDSVIAAEFKSKKDLSKEEIDLIDKPYSRLKPEKYGEIFGQNPGQQVMVQ